MQCVGLSLKRKAVFARVKCFARAQRRHGRRQPCLRPRGDNRRLMCKLLLTFVLPLILLFSQRARSCTNLAT